jgi:hypothetical protein
MMHKKWLDRLISARGAEKRCSINAHTLRLQLLEICPRKLQGNNIKLILGVYILTPEIIQAH